MRRSLKLVSLISSGALLGCSQLSLSPAQRETSAQAPGSSVLSRARVAAERKAPVATAEVENFWLQGRAAQDQGQLAQARQHYARVLQRQPGHVGALNALAVLDAQAGRLDVAIAQLQRAVVLDPAASHLYNNLGYALLLAGRLDESEAALRRAQELNPASSRTQHNRQLLAEARARGATVQQAQAEPTAPQPERTETALAAGARLHPVAPNVYELRDAATAVVAAVGRSQTVAAAPTVAAAVPVARAAASVARPAATAATEAGVLRGLRIEVSNGVGVRHMARRTAERLAPLGVVSRLTNQPGYQQPRTEIQYLPAQADAARALAGQLPQAPHLQAARHLGGQVQMRLVLGHDPVARAMVAWLDGEPGTTAAREEEAGAPAGAPLILSLVDGWRWG